MAKETILTERGSGEVMYPRTLASLVRTAGGDNVDEAIEAAKMKLFIDMWNEACRFGPYDIIGGYNEADNTFWLYEESFVLTYQEAVRVYIYSAQMSKYVHGSMQCAFFGTNTPLGLASPRALFPINVYLGTISMILYANPNIEMLYFSGAHNNSLVADINHCFGGAVKLKKIFGRLDISGVPANRDIGAAPMLEEIPIFNIKQNLIMKGCPKLSLASLQRLVTNASNTTAITVTVHPDVFAKLTDELIAAAAGKNISFATPAA